MKKLLCILFGLVLFISCDEREPTEKIRTSSNTESISVNGKKDYKIELEGHQFYFRSWSTYCGTGSDLVHNPNCWCNKRNTVE